MSNGVFASAYLPITKPSWKIIKTSVIADSTNANREHHERIVEFAPDSGYAAAIGAWDEKFFVEPPRLSSNGILTFMPTGFSGETSIRFTVVDLTDFTAGGEPRRLAEGHVSLDVESRTLLKRPAREAAAARKAGVTSPTRLHGTLASRMMPLSSSLSESTVHPPSLPSPTRTASPRAILNPMSASPPPPKTSLQVAPEDGGESRSPEKPKASVGLAATNIRSHRAPPPRVKLAAFSHVVLGLTPLLLMRQWNHHAEYRLLTDARGGPEHTVTLLRKIQNAMEEGAVVEAVVPLVDAACRLHLRLGGANNVKTAVRLAHLRVQAVGTALGLDMRLATPVDVNAAQRLSSGRKDTLDLLVRVLVESAHLLKLTGHFPDALKYYKTAATIAGTQNSLNGGGAAQIPFLFAAGDVHLLRGELDAAVQLYEEARAHAELASRGSSVVAECEQQLAFVFSVSGQVKEAEVAMKRAIAIRKEQNDPVATAEALLFEAAALACRGKGAQAAQAVIRARELGLQSGERAVYVRCVTETLAGALAAFTPDIELSWDPSVAAQCPDPMVAALARWLKEVHRPDAQRIAAICEDVESLTGKDGLLSNILAVSVAIASFDSDAAAAKSTVLVALASLEAKLTSINALIRLAVECACTSALLAKDDEQALHLAERLVWLTTNSTSPIAYAAAFRISACVAEAATAASLTAPHERLSGSDDMYALLLSRIGAQEGHFSPKIVPVLLDAAEVRHVRGDYPGALELFAKGLRIVDVKNLLYLIGPLFLPRWQLTPVELRDRDRLAHERFPGVDGLTALAMLLQQVGLTHEAAGNLPRAISALQQSVACFEIGGVEHHPGCLATLTNLARCHLALKEHATARVYLEHAEELFLDHFYLFGRYIADPQSVALRARIEAGLRASSVSERSEGSLLCKGHPANPALKALEMYV
jgi:tetratricopeptide (TPR) repeat protein